MASKIYDQKKIPASSGDGPSWIFIGVATLCGFWPGAFLLFLRLLKYARRKRYDAYRDYLAIIGDREYVRVEDLARTAGKDAMLVRQELRGMISGGYLGSKAYLDMSTGCLVVDPQTRPDGSRHAKWKAQEQPAQEQPVQAQPAQAQPVQAQSAQGKHAAPQPARETPQPPKKEKPVFKDEYESVLQQIRDLNEAIEDEGVSRKIDRIGEVTASIFKVARKHPERKDEIRTFMNYYLPTTFKLLESYGMMEKQSYQGENITNARHDIENIMDTLVKAFEQQQDRLFHADAIDISSDIDVLETMMAKDGLSEKGRGLTLGGH